MYLSFLGVCSLLICGLAVYPAAERLWISGLDAFFGEVRLTRNSGPLTPRDYASNALLKGEIALSEITHGTLFVLPQEAYFWAPDYLGFPRAHLSEQEASDLATLLLSGSRFEAAYGEPVMCWPAATAALATPSVCSEGPALHYLHQQARLQSGLEPVRYVLQFRLRDGRLAEARLYPSQTGMAYTAEQPNRVPLEGFVEGSVAELRTKAAQAEVGSVDALWPEMTADRANALAARRLGDRYRRALGFLQSLQAVQHEVGPIREIRPALGRNGSSDWMDSHEMLLTLRVLGEDGVAVVLMRGDRCWSVEMAAGGVFLDLTDGLVRPGVRTGVNGASGRGGLGMPHPGRGPLGHGRDRLFLEPAKQTAGVCRAAGKHAIVHFPGALDHSHPYLHKPLAVSRQTWGQPGANRPSFRKDNQGVPGAKDKNSAIDASATRWWAPGRPPPPPAGRSAAATDLHCAGRDRPPGWSHHRGAERDTGPRDTSARFQVEVA